MPGGEGGKQNLHVLRYNIRVMVKAQHGKKGFDKKYYSRFFKENGDLDFETYENWFDGWYKFVRRYVDLKEGENRKVLELGCAIGAFSKILDEKGFDVTATDISDFILKHALQANPGIKFKKLDIEKKQNLRQKFDYVFAFEVLEHLENPQKALLNIKKKLKKEGIFIFSTPFPSKLSLSDPTHINVHEPRWWLTVGTKVGFKERKLVYATFIPYLYRISSFFSRGFPLKLNMPYINSTCIFFFRK